MRRTGFGSWVVGACLVAGRGGLGGACDTAPEGGTDEGAACAQGEAPARLTLENRTGSVIEVVTMRAGDGSDLVDHSVPAPGVANGEDATIDLPRPGCWILGYSGGGCSADPLSQTPTEGVCSGDTFVWTAGSDTHTCAGNGW